jgi:hypothetical protein
LYGALRALGGQLKISLHPPHPDRGAPWRIAYTREYSRQDYELTAESPTRTVPAYSEALLHLGSSTGRVVEEWYPTQPDGNGVVLALRILFPQAEFEPKGNTAIDNDPEEILAYPAPESGKLVELQVYLGPRDKDVPSLVGWRAAASIPDVLEEQTAWFIPITRPEFATERAAWERSKAMLQVDIAAPGVTVGELVVTTDVNGVRCLTSIRHASTA